MTHIAVIEWRSVVAHFGKQTRRMYIVEAKIRPRINEARCVDNARVCVRATYLWEIAKNSDNWQQVRFWATKYLNNVLPLFFLQKSVIDCKV